MPVVCVMPTSPHSHFCSIHSEWSWTLWRCCTGILKKTNCGRKSNFQGQACLSWCKCKKKGCSQLCKCKYCKNTHGVRPPPSSTRRRISYDEQRQPLRGKTTDSFLHSKGEHIVTGYLTSLEDISLRGIVTFFITHGVYGVCYCCRNTLKSVHGHLQCMPTLWLPLYHRNDPTIYHILWNLSNQVIFVCVLLVYNSW